MRMTLALVLASTILATAQDSSQLPKAPSPVELSAIKVDGELDRRVRLGLHSLLVSKKRIFGAEGHTQTWGEDGIGRWIHAIGMLRSYTGDALPELDRAVAQLLRFPDAAQNGYFTNPEKGSWWGHSRALVGLLQYWEGRQDFEVLRLATRLGDYALSSLPVNSPGSTFLAGHIEALLALWRVTGNADYLTLAEKIPFLVDSKFGVPDGKTGKVHTHTFLALTHGCVDLYLATGKKEYLERAQELWDHAVNHNMWVSGGISEIATDPFETNDETCAVADWLRLSLKLWRATRDPKYMDVAELTLLNHLYFDQEPNGGFCTSRSIAKARAGRVRDVVAWFCCSMHGSTALLDAIKFIYTHDEQGIDVNLFVASEANIPVENGPVHVKQITAYPAEPRVRLELQTRGQSQFRMGIRVPEWSCNFSLAVNGKPLQMTATNGYVQIQRVWKSGDAVEISFSPRLVMVSAGQNGVSPLTQKLQGIRSESVEGVALRYGPLVLMVDPRLQPHHMYTWDRIEVILPREKDGEISLPKTPIPIPGRGDLSVPGMCFMTLGRKRAETEAPVGLSNKSWKLVFLVPISEVTDRLTYTSSRTAPYEVRNDVRLLSTEQTAQFLEQVQDEFRAYVERIKSTTTPYRMFLLEQGRDAGPGEDKK